MPLPCLATITDLKEKASATFYDLLQVVRMKQEKILISEWDEIHDGN